jgi:hypothetical protein
MRKAGLVSGLFLLTAIAGCDPASMPVTTAKTTGGGTAAPAESPRYYGDRVIELNATVSINGFSFAQNWVARPGLSAGSFCMNPVWVYRDAVGNVRPVGAAAIIDVYDEDMLGASADKALDGLTLPLTSEGFCVSFAGRPSGNYHFSYLDGTFWALYAEAAYSPATDKTFLEKNPRGSFGLVVYWNGTTFQKATTGANF